MDFNTLKADLEKEGKIVVSEKKDAYEVFIPDRAKLKVEQVSGSTAGAGSGDFHVYRGSRRRERFRVAKILADSEAQEKFENFMKRKEQAHIEQTTRTQKNAAKRKRKKDAKKMWKKKSKIEGSNQYRNDGNFMEQFLKKKEGAIIDAPQEWKDAVLALEAKGIFTMKKPGKWKAKKGSHTPTCEMDGADVVIQVKHAFSKKAGGDHWIEWIYAKGEDGKIVGIKKFSVEDVSAGEFPRVRFQNLEVGSKLTAYAYCNLHGMWKSTQFEVEAKMGETKVLEAGDLEALGQKLCTLIEQESAESIKRHGEFHVAFSAGNSLDVIQASNSKIKANVAKWHIYTTNETLVGEDGKGSVAEAVRTSVAEPWEVPSGGLHMVNQEALKDADKAAETYAQELTELAPGLIDKELDLIILNLGEDGRICHLLPGSPLLKNMDVYVAPADGGHVTFTYALLNAAKTVAIVAKGKKAKSLAKKLQNDQSSELPGGLVKGPKIVWFLA